MSDGDSFRQTIVEVQIAKVNFDWPKDRFEEFLVENGVIKEEIDAMCLRLQRRCQDGTAEMLTPVARNRLYDLGLHKKMNTCSVMGVPYLDESVFGNGLCRELMCVCIGQGLRTGLTHEDLLWMPGMYGPGRDKNYPGYWLRPVGRSELLLKYPAFVREASLATRHFTISPSGLYCVDRDRMNDLRTFARSLNATASVRFWPHTYAEHELSRTYQREVWELIQWICDSPPEELSGEQRHAV